MPKSKPIGVYASRSDLGTSPERGASPEWQAERWGILWSIMALKLPIAQHLSRDSWYLIIGFGFYWAWVDSALFLPTLYSPYNEILNLSAFHLIVILVALLSLTCIVFSPFLQEQLRRLGTHVLLTSFMVSGSICALLAGYFHNGILLTLAFLAMGVGMGAFAVVWGIEAVTLKRASSVIAMPGVIACAAFSGILCMNLLPIAAIILTLVFPILSLLFLLLFRRGRGRIAAMQSDRPTTTAARNGARQESSSLDRDDRTISKSKYAAGLEASFFKKVPWRFFVFLFVFSLSFGIMTYLLVAESPEAEQIGRFNIVLRGAIALVFFLCMGLLTLKPQIVYKAGFLLIIAGFLISPFAKDVALSSAIIMLGYTCYDMMAWIVICALGNEHRKEAARLVALSRLVCLSGVLVGGICGLNINALIPLAHIDKAIVTTAIAYLLVTTILLSFDRGPDGFWGVINTASLNPVSPNADTVARAVASLTQIHQLTPREGEFASYLAQGRTIPWICEHLAISDGTGRSHARHIYAKLEVHSRQRFLDVVDEKVRQLEEQRSESLKSVT